MQKETIIPEHIIPESVQITSVSNFVIDPNIKVIYVTLSDNTTSTIQLNTVWSQMTAQQKTIVKGFFAALAKIALNTDTIVGDITD